MPDSTIVESSGGQWKDHDAKRRRTTLKAELLETQADTLRRLFNRGNGKLTDMTIWCGTKLWRVHSCILASRCEFFRVCIEGNFKESKARSVWMEDDPPAALEIFLEYLYTLDDFTAVRCLRGGRPSSKMRDLLDLCKIADKYDQKLLLEQIFDIFDAESRYDAYLVELEALLLAYKELTDIENSPWVSRIRGAVLTCLLKPGKLQNLDTKSKKMLQENTDLGFSIIELLADRCEDQEQRLSRQSFIIDDDWIPDETELAAMGC